MSCALDECMKCGGEVVEWEPGPSDIYEGWCHFVAVCADCGAEKTLSFILEDN